MSPLVSAARRRSVRLTQYGLAEVSGSPGFQWRSCRSHPSAR